MGAGIELSARQQEIIEIVKKNAPITGEQIADYLGTSRPTIRSDLSVLVMLGFIDAKPKVGYFLGTTLSPEGRLNARLQGLKVKDIMGRPVVIRENETVNDAVISLFVEHAALLIVTDDEGWLSGMVSVKDLVKVTLGNPNVATVPIHMVMTRLPRVITVLPEDSALEAAQKMMEHQIGGLPVVRLKQTESAGSRFEVIGRITKTHIMRLLVDVARDI